MRSGKIRLGLDAKASALKRNPAWRKRTPCPLSSPLHGIPLCGGDRVVITAGVYDRLSPASDLLNLKRRWSGARLLEVRQGHFGYRALRETLKEIERFL
jgi:hypothetical protein